ncbi:MAG: dprA [Flaviaesturariibacter sp.]|nr:dprA [Flaviaesturariibacter sp.]
MNADLVYQLALTLVPQIGDVHARILLQHFGDARSIFSARLHQLEKLEGIGLVRATAIKQFADFHLAEAEAAYVEKFRIRVLFLDDPAYPRRLLNCYDAPTLLFYKGTADLNAKRMLAIVGTRSQTEYGKTFTETLVSDLASEGVTIVSGLAFGIDATAHKAAVKNNLPTVGVVGHGLARIYPAAHAGLARDMVEAGGGVLSEFFSGTMADKHHFPLRNRVVAGLCDATVVVETAVKGGSMITAKMAGEYNRDVFAVPGRTTDKNSAGCLHLVRQNKAMVLTSAADLIDIMGWREASVGARKQRALFVDLTKEETAVLDILREKELVPIDELNLRSGLSSSTVAAALLNLELNGIVTALPGKLYKLT